MYFYNRMDEGVCTDYRLLNLRRLTEELDGGIIRMGLSEDDVTEAKRLGRLSKKVLRWEITG